MAPRLNFFDDAAPAEGSPDVQRNFLQELRGYARGKLADGIRQPAPQMAREDAHAAMPEMAEGGDVSVEIGEPELVSRTEAPVEESFDALVDDGVHMTEAEEEGVMDGPPGGELSPEDIAALQALLDEEVVEGA